MIEESNKTDDGVEFNVRSKVKITNEDIDFVICAAIEGGISYWCNKVEIVGDKLGEYTSDHVSRGGTLLFHTIEDGKKIKLTLSKFIEGLQKYISLDNYHCIANGIVDTYEMDSADADGIIQCALFGEIIYA